MAATEADGHGIHSFLWSEQEYEPRDLFEQFGHLLPFVAMVTQGYCGKDEPIHMFASKEMYWLRDVAFQKRVVCRDNNKDYYSIPLCYPERVTPSQSNGIDGPMMTIEEMMSESKYRFFTFEAGCHSITKNADILQNKVLGTLEITETYEERFLIAHTLLSEVYHEPPSHQYPEGFYNTAGVLSNCTVIPLYMPIALAVAVGMSDTETENFHRTMHNFQEFVGTLHKDYDEILKAVSDIMAFDEAPSGGDYEYIHFLQFIRANKDMKNISSDGYWVISGVPNISPKPEPPPRRPDLTGAESGPAPKRPPKRGESKGSTIVTKLFKKKTKAKDSTKKLPNFKERAPSPTSDSDASFNDSFQNQEFVNIEGTSYERPVSTYATLIPTPIAYREGRVALGVDTKLILTTLNHMFSNGTIPKSTKLVTAKKKNFVMQPEHLSNVLKNDSSRTYLDQSRKRQREIVSTVSSFNDSHPAICSSRGTQSHSADRPDCKTNYMDKVSMPCRALMRSSLSANDDVNHHTEMSSHKEKSQCLDKVSCSQKSIVQNSSVSPVLKRESFKISEILSTKQNLKRAGRSADVLSTGSQPARTDRYTDDITKPSAAAHCANENRLSKSLGLRHQQKQTGTLIQETPPRTYEDKFPKENTIGEPSTKDELNSVLEQQRQRINAPVVERGIAAVSKEQQLMVADDQLKSILERRRTKSEQDPETETSTTEVKYVHDPKDNSETGGREETCAKTHGQDIAGAIQEKLRHVPVHRSNVAVIQPKVRKKPTVNAISKNSQLGMKIGRTESSDVKKSKYVLEVLSDDIVSGADIPQDVSKFTVGDVARCLELLDMSDYVDQFIAQQIDGAFLQGIDANMLQAEFGITCLMATQLVMFAKAGWRPTV